MAARQPSPDPLFTLRGDMESIHSLLFHSEGDCNFILAATRTGIIHKWDIQKCREVSQVTASSEACLVVKYLKNCFITQVKGGEIKIFQERELEKPKVKVDTDYMGFCKLEVYNDEFLVSPASDSKVKIIDLNGKVLYTLSCTNKIEKIGEIMALKCGKAFETDYVFVLYESGLLVVFQTNGCEVTCFKISSDCPMALDFDGESKLVIGSSGDVIVGVELTSDLRLVKYKDVAITNPGVSCVVIRPDKRLFVAGCWDSRVRLFSMKSFKLLAVLQNHSQTIQDVQYSRGRVDTWNCQWLLASAGQDGRISLWSVY